MIAEHFEPRDAAGIELVMAGLAHDVRGALGVIKLLTTLASRELARGDVPGALQTLSRLDASLSKGTELCNDTLECMRRRSTSPPLAREPVDLHELVNACLAEHAEHLESAQCPIDVRLGEPIIVLSHRRSVERIFANLLRNAIVHGSGRPIEVYARATENGAIVVVRDHGCGIPRALLDRLFRPWQRSDGDDVAFERFGLGLWIVKSLVESLGGALHVSTEPALGTAMGFFLAASPGSLADVEAP